MQASIQSSTVTLDLYRPLLFLVAISNMVYFSGSCKVLPIAIQWKKWSEKNDLRLYLKDYEFMSMIARLPSYLFVPPKPSLPSTPSPKPQSCQRLIFSMLFWSNLYDDYPKRSGPKTVWLYRLNVYFVCNRPGSTSTV